MADANETIADIIAEKRREANYIVQVAQGKCHTRRDQAEDEARDMRREADRLEAAHKREIDEIKKLVADLQQQLPKPDPNWRDICAKCFENGATEPPDCKYYTEDGCISPIPDQHPLIQVGNVAKLREVCIYALAELEHFRKCNDSRLHICDIVHVGNAKHALKAALSATATAEKSSTVGDAAKLREALEKIAYYDKDDANMDDPYCADGRICADIARQALAAPPRNCDRPECATTKAAQEVWRREDGGKTAHYAWLLAPHKEGGKDGNK